MTDPGQVFKSFRELQAKHSAGEIKTPLAKDATPEQVAAYRKANSLPEAADGYFEKMVLPNGVVMGEHDKPVIAKIAGLAHSGAWPQEQFNSAVSLYHEIQNEQLKAMETADAENLRAAKAELAKEWTGKDLDTNMHAVGIMVSHMPEELRDSLLTARTPDGKLVGDLPGFNRWAAQMAREFFPTDTLLPQGTPDTMKGVTDRIAEIDEVYRKAASGDGESHRKYYGTDGQPGLQHEQRSLIDAQLKMRQRSAA